MAERKQDDHLDAWMLRIRDGAAARGVTSVLGYDDQLLGDVLVLSLPGEAGLCEVIATRTRRHRARVAAVAESKAAAERVAAVLGGLHHEVPRLANAMRKFVHRVERVVQHLAAEWTAREQGFPVEALARVRAVIPTAAPMTGVGYHTDLVGAPERHGKRPRGEHYETVYAIAVPIGGVIRALARDPGQRAFVVHPALLGELLGPAVATTDLKAHALTTTRTAATGGEAAVTAAAIAGAALAAGGLEPVPPQQRNSRWCDGLDCTDGCDVIECGFALGDIASNLGSCVPDCDGFDVPDCDVGGCDL